MASERVMTVHGHRLTASKQDNHPRSRWVWELRGPRGGYAAGVERTLGEAMRIAKAVAAARQLAAAGKEGRR